MACSIPPPPPPPPFLWGNHTFFFCLFTPIVINLSLSLLLSSSFPLFLYSIQLVAVNPLEPQKSSSICPAKMYNHSTKLPWRWMVIENGHMHCIFFMWKVLYLCLSVSGNNALMMSTKKKKALWKNSLLIETLHLCRLCRLAVMKMNISIEELYTDRNSSPL